MTVDLPQHLLDTLEVLGYAGDEGLVTTAHDLPAGPRDYVWHDLKVNVRLDAAFFRDGVPLIGFTGAEHPEGLAAVRRRLWNYGRVPILISSTTTAPARAYNAVSYSNKTSANANMLIDDVVDRDAIARQLAEAFGRSEVESGYFAERYSGAYKRSERVDSALLNNLQYLRSTSSSPRTMQRAAIDALIGGSLTATYLSQRGILTPDYLGEIAGLSNIHDILSSGSTAARRLFQGLADHFNGDVFGPLPEMISSVQESVIPRIASLLQGDDLPSGQQSLWPYDFQVIPADLVSSIYEQLLEETRDVDSAYYTPRFVVNMLLDETVPWSDYNKTAPKLVDLACGSGAFMTEAFRRLCYRARKQLDRNLTYDELQSLLKDHIYGVDRNPVAARTAAFGLYLGLLEQLDPPTIWETAILPPLLGTNVIVSDAFEQHALSEQRFDIVIGNPPWKSQLSAAATRFIKRDKMPVADKQIASAFLWLAARMLRPGGTLGLVMPAQALLHNRSDQAEQFRAAVFNRLRVRVLADLSAIRRIVFRTAAGPASIIVADLPDPQSLAVLSRDHDEILYVSAHPRPLSGAVDALTIAPEEVRGISRKQAESRPEIWNTLVWGSGRDIELVDRLRTSYPSLEALTLEHDWTSGQGYQVGGGDEYDACHLIGLPIIPTEAVQPLRITEGARQLFDLQYLHRTRKAELFYAPHVLIRRTITRGRISAVLVDENAVFPNGVVGIAGPEEDKPLLATVAVVVSSSLGLYWQFMTSAFWGKEREAVELGEHLSLPFPHPTESEALSFLALSNSVGVKGLPPQSLLDDMVFDLYKLVPEDRERIRHFAISDLPRFLAPSRRFSDSATREWLESYSNVIAWALQNTLADAEVRSSFEKHGNYCTVAIVINDAPTEQEWQHEKWQRTMGDDLTVDVDQIIQAQHAASHYGTGIFALPAGFYVNEDTVYIVKTADRDRWSRDAALDDADRIFSALAFGI